jgi:hypothetical protein
MTRFKRCFVSSALLFGAAVPALAASSAASSASEGSSASVGSLSDSFKGSSDSSSRTTTAAEGEYQVIDVAAVAERPGTVRMKLQALAERAEEREFFLYLPEQTLAQSRVAPGQIVMVRQRAYGLEFARGDTHQAFFLVLSDDWYRELRSNAVVL